MFVSFWYNMQIQFKKLVHVKRYSRLDKKTACTKKSYTDFLKYTYIFLHLHYYFLQSSLRQISTYKTTQAHLADNKE